MESKTLFLLQINDIAQKHSSQGTTQGIGKAGKPTPSKSCDIRW